MNAVVVPVRYPLADHSKRTLSEAVRVAEERDATLVVLNINLSYRGREVTHAELRRAVESEIGRPVNTRYVVRDGFLVEETILEEVAATEADAVVIGHKQAGRWRRMLRRLASDPDIEGFLRGKLDTEVVTVGD